MLFDGAAIAAVSGLAGGLVLGLAARLGRVCGMGAVEDAIYGDDTRRLRMLGLAAATAIALTALLTAAELIEPEATRFLSQGWSPAGAVFGGLIFGYGMALVGTCGFGALARTGGGDLRAALTVSVIAVTAGATLNGPLAPIRLGLVGSESHAAATSSLADQLDRSLGIGPLFAALAIAAALATVCLAGGRRSAGGALGLTQTAWALAIGAVVALAWTATTLAGRIGFDQVPPENFSFIAPLSETLGLVMRGDWPDFLDFSVAAVIGVALGGAVGALLAAEFRWEACDDARELRRQIAGAALMGVGGVFAGGCTIGQGLSALSLLSVSAPLVILAIFAGARLGLYVLVERSASAS
ncbi:MAG: YeeE/YedE family protein [Pikeienuella sp.]